MRNRTTLACLLASAGLALLGGCSSGSRDLSVAPASSSTSTAGKGVVQVTFQWPEVSRSRMIPSATQSIQIVLVDSKGQPQASVIAQRPATGSSSVLTLKAVTAGIYTETASAYATTDASGVPQAQGSQPINIKPDILNKTADLVMNTTIATVTITPGSSSVKVGDPAVALTATATDKSGRVVLSAPANFQWSSDKLTLGTLTPSGATATFKPLAAGTVKVTVKESEANVTSAAATLVIGSVTTPPPASTLIVADSSNKRILGFDKLPPTSTLSFDASNGGVFYDPESIARDTQGRLYIADYQPGSSRILRIDDLSGKNQVVYAPAGSTASVVAVDKAGHIYFRDDNAALNRIDDITGTNLVTFGGRGGATSNPLGNLYSVAFDSQNRIYMCTGFGVVRIDDMTGKNLTSFGLNGSGVNQFKQDRGIAIDAADRIYVADGGNGRIVRFDDMTGTNWTSFTVPAGTNASSPLSIAVTGGTSPQIYFFDNGNSVLYRIDDMTGKNLVQYGSAGSGSGQFSFANGLIAQ